MKKTCASLILVLLPAGAYSSELKVVSNVSASYVNFDIDSQETSETGSETFSVLPYLSALYNSKRLNSSLSASLQHVDRSFSGLVQDNGQLDGSENYFNYNYNVDFQAIDNLLALTASGNRRLQNLDPANALSNSVYYGADQLTTTTQQSGGFKFGTPQSRYVGLVINGNYSDLTSDRQFNRTTSLKTNNTNLTSRLFSGRDLKNISFEFVHQYNDTDVSEGIRSDLLSRTISGSVSFPLFKDLRILVEGRSEENTYRGEANIDSGELEYESGGIGLSWRKSPERFINITYNQSTDRDNDKDEFLGATVNWRFSSRTSLYANYGRRFFGETGTFRLNHNTRKFQTRISYSESLTTFTRLFTEQVDLGTFVCPAGATGIGECFLPDSDYELQAGEALTSFTGVAPDLVEQVILRKSLSSSIGYQFRRLKATLAYSQAETDYLDSNQDTEDQTMSLLFGMNYGPRTSISWSNRFLKIDRISLDTEEETFSSDLQVSYDLTRHFKLGFELGYTDRDSTDELRDLRNTRAAVKFTYTFL